MTTTAHANDAGLLFRRQYIMGPRPLERPGWAVERVADDLWLTVHPDLGIARCQRNGVQLIALGYILDPYAPEASDQQVLEGIAERSRSFEDVILHAQAASGRFVIVYSDGSSVKAFSDTIGSRAIFYTRRDGELWCAAQPALLGEYLELTRDEDPLLLEYVRSAVYQQNQRFWPGDGTIYVGVRHVLPNHYLDVRTGAVTRYWPREALARLSPEEAVPVAAEILTGSLRAAARRRPLMLTVTAGLDSRMLLAASRPVAPEVYYYVQRLRPEHYAIRYDAQPDITVPAELVRRLGFDFHVLEATERPDSGFSAAIDASVTMARDTAKPGLYALRKHEARMRVTGIACEISRVKLYPALRGRKLTGGLLAEMEHAGDAFAGRRFAEWLTEVEGVEEEYGVSPIDLFCWEQKYGNWAALGSAEGSIVGEMFPPFNNRKLLATLMSVDVRHRSPPGYRLHRQVIRHMWAETLSAPINPKPLSARVAAATKRVLRRFLGKTPLWAYFRARNTRARLARSLARAVTPPGPAGAEPGGAGRPPAARD